MNNQRVREFISRKPCEQKNLNIKFTTSIAAYPQNNIKEIAKIMADIKIDSIPVFVSPWNKKLIGFIEFNKIQPFLRE